jgi:two-component sensor histidine kinase
MTMEQPPNPQAVFSKLTGRTIDAVTIWAEANQQILTQLADLTAGTARESARLCGDLQQGAIKALRTAPLLPWQPGWQDGCQQAFQAFEGNLQAMSRSAERLQASAEQAGRAIQETVTGVASKMKDVYSQN